ncbi:MAG: MmcB family DNA repair protein [Alphaproteobacteria bacterium]
MMDDPSQTNVVRERDTTRADDIRMGAQILLRQFNIIAAAEVTLPDGRRADLFGIDPKGRVTIVEIKSGAADFLSDNKWTDYKDWCDDFYFAVDPDFPQDLLPEAEGLIIADRMGGEILRPAAPADPIAAARRKKLLILYARKAADRLARLERLVGKIMLDDEGA